MEVESINVHPRLIKTHIKKRITSLESPIPETTIDFSTAEALALGSLMMEGFNVRLSGQVSDYFFKIFSIFLICLNDRIPVEGHSLTDTQHLLIKKLVKFIHHFNLSLLELLKLLIHL